MSEDFSIQQGVQPQSSATPYTLTGAVIGGGAGALGAHYFTKPKYGDIQDIVKETTDKDKWEKKVSDAPEEDKKFLESVKEYADKQESAGTEYDTKFEEYKKNNQVEAGKKETDAYKQLVDAQNNAEKALNDKKAALAAEEIETTVTEAKNTLPENQKVYLEKQLAKRQRALNQINEAIAELKKSSEELFKPLKEDLKPMIDMVYNANNAVEAAKDRERELTQALNAEKDAAKRAAIETELAKVQDVLKQARKNLDNIWNQLIKGDKAAGKPAAFSEMASAIVDEGLKGKKLQDAIDAKAKQIQTFVESSVQERFLNERKNADVVKGIIDKQENAFNKILRVARRDLSDKNPEQVAQRVQLHIDKVETPNLERMKTIQKAYIEALDAAKKSGNSTTVVQHFEGRIGKGFFSAPFEGTSSTVTTNGVQNAIDIAKTGLNEKEKQILDDIVAGKDEAQIKQAFEDVIKQRTENISTLKNAVADVQNAATQIKELGGEGAYIRNGVLYKEDGAKVEFKPKTFKVASDIDVPVTSELRNMQEQAAAKEAEIAELKKKLTPAQTTVQGPKVKKYTPEQIVEQVKEEQRIFDEAKAAREKAYNDLEDIPKKSEEDLRKAFHESLGAEITDRDSYIKRESEKALESIKKDYAEQLKRKFGFAEHANLKIAAVAAAGAAVLGGLAYLMAPKDRS